MNAISSSSQLDSTETLALTLPPIVERRILAVIVKQQKELSRHFTPAELSQEVHLSGSQLQALFSKTVGMPLAQFTKQMRLTVARHLFVTEFLTVGEVMTRVGFHDKSHFTHDFKKAYGISPGKFRQQYLKGK